MSVALIAIVVLGLVAAANAMALIVVSGRLRISREETEALRR